MNPQSVAECGRGVHACFVRAVVYALVLLCAVVFSEGSAAAQTLTAASVSGTVTDPNGAGVSGAWVELRNAETDQVRRQMTGENGQFSFSPVARGLYSLSVSMPGFRRAVVPSINVSDTVTYPLDVALEVGELLETVVVTGTRSEQEIGKISSAVSVVSKSEIQRGERASTLEESLKRVPGVRVEDELGGNGSRIRIEIRGAGTRANSPAGSGVRGVKVLVDGIPKNNAGGSAQDLTNIDLQSAERIEVLRGPSSVLYGNQSGGVVNILTEEGPQDFTMSYRQTLGSYQLYKEHFKLGGQHGRLNYFGSLFRNDQNGYRDHSRFNNTGFHSKLRFAPDSRSSLTGIASFDRNFQQSPGPLTAQRFAANPRQADPTFLANNVHSVVKEARFALIYHRELFGQDDLEITAYAIPRKLKPFRQIGVFITQYFINRGTSIRYLNATPLGKVGNRFTAGFEYQNTPITTDTVNSTTGRQTSALREHANTAGVYFLEEITPVPELTFTIGGRFDNVDFKSRNFITTAPEAHRVFRKFTPKVGLAYRPTQSVSLYANFSRGFETPIIGELRVLPGGVFGFNTDLDPQVSTNYEVGARGGLFRNRLTFETAVFRQNVRDFISPFGTFPNNSFQNVGEVKQNGFELASRLQVMPRLTLALTYTFSDFVFEEFNNGVNNFTGNRLPGVPKHQTYGEIRYTLPVGIYGSVESQYVGGFFVNDANTFTNAPYAVTNLRFGYDREGRGRIRFAPFLGINNLFDRRYSAFALINDAARRFYNPQPGLSVFGGLGITY